MLEIGRFKNRAHAGELLARELAAYAHRPDVIVLALPRGGVPVGFAVARRLGVELDILVVRKLGMPGHEEFAMGAVGSGGVRVLNPDLPRVLGVTAQDVEAVAARERAELARRERAYRGARAPLALGGRCAILVDDGVATGSSMLAAIQVARHLQPAELVLAIPVAPPETVRLLAPQVDALVCLAAPPGFRSVGQWYEHFDQTDDVEVEQLLTAAWHDRAAQIQPTSKGPNDETNHHDGHRL